MNIDNFKITRVGLRQHIQVLRGFAVLSVLFFHFFPTIFPLGYLGVDLFFTISGFVITLYFRSNIELYQGNRFLFIRSFYRRRFFRLIPALSVVVGLTIICSVFFLHISDLRITSLQGIFTILSLGNFGAYLTSADYFHPTLNPLLHTWSLGAEEQIYFLLPLLLLPLLKRRPSPINWLYLIALIVCFELFILNVPEIFPTLPLPSHWQSFLFYSPFMRLCEVLIGVSAGFLIELSYPARYIFFSAFLFLGIFGFIFGLDLWIVVSSFLICTSIILQFGSNLSFGNVRVLSWLGSRSYSIYLVHMPLKIFICGSSVSLANWIAFSQKVLGFSLSITLGSFLYESIERRFRTPPSSSDEWSLSKSVAIFILIPLIMCSLLFYYQAQRTTNFIHHLKVPVYGKLNSKSCSDSSLGFRVCGSGSSTTILLGDSHAEMYGNSIYRLFKLRNVGLIDASLTSCKYLPFHSTKLTQECNLRNRNFETLISSSSRYSLVYSQYFSDALEVNQTLKYLSSLPKNVRNITIIGLNPVWPDSSTFLKMGRAFDSQSVPAKVSSIDHFDQSALLEAHLSHEVTRYARVKLLDPFGIFCTNTECFRAEANGEWLYIDGNHLSALGAERIIQAYAASLLIN